MNRARLAARLSLVALTIACGSDSGIVEPTTLSAREAVYFDQLLGSACNNSNQTARCTFLTNFALPQHLAPPLLPWRSTMAGER